MSRLATTNATLMAEWRDSFNETDRVPVMPYLRSVPRLKPLGSAVTSVFVSTFAMLSVAWTIFNLIAGAVAASHTDKAVCEEDEANMTPGPYMRKDLEGQQGSMEEWGGSETSPFAPEQKHVLPQQTLIERLIVEKTSAAMSEMQLSLESMRHALRQHSILESAQKLRLTPNHTEFYHPCWLFIIIEAHTSFLGSGVVNFDHGG
ncbi:hypothetical protein B0H17DRAFT_1265519 [Mycena rosella]|uniref:Uncharacterized protein n=1 Tax=Mycena rosella TaxID=1033263 RepID=A0AAD7CP21_MYCRO|nr:hypothetical protein B0H17DRAFT_1265519 [Mycena rosella]